MKNHGRVRLDNYYWMKERDSKDVVDYIKKENQFTDAVFHKPTKKMQTKIYQEIKNRIKLNDQSAPIKRDDYFYYNKQESNKDYSIHVRRKGSMHAAEEIILDENQLAKGLKFSAVGKIEVSPDHTKLAFTHDIVSRRTYNLKIRDLISGKITDLGIENAASQVVWSEDNKTLYYISKDKETLREEKLWQLDIKTGEKKELYYEKDVQFSLNLEKSDSKKYIFLRSEQTKSSEYRYLDTKDTKASLKVFRPRTKDVLYYVKDAGDKFYILTNEKAVNFKVMESSHKTPDKWTEIVAHNPGVYIESIEATKQRLVTEEKKNGLTDIIIRKNNGEKISKINVKGNSYVLSLSDVIDFDKNLIRYSYETMAKPYSLYDMNVTDFKSKVVKTEEIKGDFDASKYETKRIWITVRDGEKYPFL